MKNLGNAMTNLGNDKSTFVLKHAAWVCRFVSTHIVREQVKMYQLFYVCTVKSICEPDSVFTRVGKSCANLKKSNTTRYCLQSGWLLSGLQL